MLPAEGWLPTPLLNPIESGPLPLPHVGLYFEPDAQPPEVVSDVPDPVTFVTLGQGAIVATGRAGRNVKRLPLMVARLEFHDVYGILLVDRFDVPESPGLLSGEDGDDMELGVVLELGRLDDYVQQLVPDELDLGFALEGFGLERAGCTMRFVLESAQEESGVAIAAVSTWQAMSRHVVEYRGTLASICSNAWQDVEQGDIEFLVSDGPVIAIPPMEAVWEIFARDGVTGEWVKAQVVSPEDPQLGALPLYLRDTEIELLEPARWVGYDRVRLAGIQPPDKMIDPAETILPPNELIGPVFCRCLVLEAARYLALQADEPTVAGSLAAELRSARHDLLRQAASHMRTRTTRQ